MKAFSGSAQGADYLHWGDKFPTVHPAENQSLLSKNSTPTPSREEGPLDLLHVAPLLARHGVDLSAEGGNE